MTRAFTQIRGSGPIVLTCEHATQVMPEPWTWPDADKRLVGTHWAFDPGAAEITRKIARRTKSHAVLSHFSRLLVDPNRELTSDSLFRMDAEGLPVELNQDLSPEDREARLDGYYRPYHAAVNAAVRDSSAPVILSMHSFTPVYEGSPRPMEVGVLFDLEERLAVEAGRAFERAGFSVAYNAPYSGKGGLMYAVEHHAVNHGRRALELEIRQDLAVRPEDQTRVVEVVAALVAGF